MFRVIPLPFVLLLHAAAAAPAPEPAALEPRIYGGSAVASDTQLPFIASMQEDDRFDGCGGAVLAPTKIVTAGHCVHDKNPDKKALYFRVGSLRWAGSGGKLAKVKSRKVHDKFEPDTLDYDVAIVTLEEPLDLKSSPSLQAAKLVARDTRIKSNQPLEIAGWGDTKPNLKVMQPSDVLMHAFVEKIDRLTCKMMLERGRPLTATMMCAAGDGQDACAGDSGGPIVDKASRALLGVGSWGSKDCGNPDYPGIYTDFAVKEINDWIRKNAGLK